MRYNRTLLVIFITLVFIGSTLTSVFGNKTYALEEDQIILNFEFDEPIVEKIEKNQDNFDKIIISGLSNTNNINSPSLPIKTVKILLPYNKKMQNIKVVESDEKTLCYSNSILTGSPLFPVTSVNINSNKVNRNSNLVESHKKLFSDVNTYSYRGFSILHINLFPVQYDSETGRIYYYNSMKVIIDTKESDNNKVFRADNTDFSYINKIVYNPKYIDTYKTNNNPKSIDDNYKYIIITNQNFKNMQGDYSLQSLVQSKIDNGVTAGIFTVEEIYANDDYSVNGVWGDANPSNPFYESPITGSTLFFDDNAARIRNFIRYVYTELGTKYVLLAGDADEIVPEDNIVPYRGLFADEDGLPLPDMGILAHEEDDIPSDVYYACLDGNFNYDCDIHFGESPDYCDDEVDEADLYAEVWVGRACIDSEDEIENFVKKTLYYEQNNDDYLSEIAFIGEYLGFPGVSAYGGNYKDYMQENVQIPDSYNINKIYDREEEWQTTWLIDHLSNNYYHFINHDGHGNHYYIFKGYGEYVRDLTNEKPFFLYSHSCLTGSFDNYNCFSGYKEYDCIAEVLTCEIEYGAFACILNARYGLGSEDTLESPSGLYDESFYKAIFEENIQELGRASHFSKEYYVNRINENGMRWTYYQTNLFGDPELRIKGLNNAPIRPSISGPTKGKPGQSYDYIISSTDPEGEDVYYWVEWYQGCPGVYWDGPYNSGEQLTYSNTWDSKGSYTIRVSVKDENGNIGPDGTLVVSMPKNKQINFLKPFDRYQKFLSIFSNLFKF